MILDKIALFFAIVGGLNWGCVGLFKVDLVAYLCGGVTTPLARIIYVVVGLSALWCVTLLFRDTQDNSHRHTQTA